MPFWPFNRKKKKDHKESWGLALSTGMFSLEGKNKLRVSIPFKRFIVKHHFAVTNCIESLNQEEGLDGLVSPLAMASVSLWHHEKNLSLKQDETMKLLILFDRCINAEYGTIIPFS